MITLSVNFMDNSTSAALSATILESFLTIPTPHISDNLARLSGITGLTRFHRQKKLIGRAFTVKTRPGDNLVVYQAITQLTPGQVLVIDGAGHQQNALVGELIMQYAMQRGCHGFVIDGAIRDSDAFYQQNFPCYAAAVTHRGPFKNGPGELNVPVTVGGQVISPGDIIVGDDDGVVSFAAEQVAALLQAITLTAAKEEKIKQEIATGQIEQSWINHILKLAND